jgi:hypothetical protein
MGGDASEISLGANTKADGKAGYRAEDDRVIET